MSYADQIRIQPSAKIMRSLIADGIEENADDIAAVGSRVDNIITHNGDGTKDSELVDLRTAKDGTVYPTAKGRVDAIESVLGHFELMIEADQEDEISSELQAKIDLIYATGYKGTIKAKGNYVLDNTIIVKDNVKIDFSECTLTTSKTGTNVPLHFFLVQGDNVSISANISLNKDNVAANYGRGIGFTGEIKTIYNNITIEKCNLQYCYYGVYASGVQLNNIKIIDNSIVGISSDICIQNLLAGTNNIKIKRNDFPIERNWTTPVTPNCNIVIFSGVHYPYSDQMTDAIYTGNYADRVFINDNTFYKPKLRAITVGNIKNIHVKDNTIINTPDVALGSGGCDDVICLQFCRNFEVNGNTIENSGQNGIDILSCQNGTVSSNTVINAYTNAIGLDKTDIFVGGYATNLSNAYHLVKNVAISGNTISAKGSCIDLRLANGVSITGNNLSLTNSSGSHLTMQISHTNSLFTKDSTYFNITNVKCSNNTIDTDKAKLYFDSSTYYQYINWGSIELGRSLAVQSDWIDVNNGSTYGWTHNLGKYNTVEFYFYIDPANYSVYGTSAGSVGSDRIKVGYQTTYDNNAWATKGVSCDWHDLWSVIYVTGSTSIVDGAYRTSGAGSNLYNVTSGKIKILTY